MSDPLKSNNMILHIDGGSMGGGGPIPHHDKTLFNEKLSDNDDFWDLKDKYFNHERQGIFHYCIFAHDADLGEGTSLLNPTGTHMGISEMPYEDSLGNEGADDFIIGDSNWHKSIPDLLILFGIAGRSLEPKGDDATVQAAIFMHELGHNLGLIYTGGVKIGEGEEGWNPDGLKTCMNYYYILSLVNYTNDEWKNLDLENIKSAEKGFNRNY